MLRHRLAQVRDRLPGGVQNRLGIQPEPNERCGHRRHDSGLARALLLSTPEGTLSLDVDRVISTMPITDLVLRMQPPPPPEVVEAAQGLSYRSIATVNLFVDRPELIPDTWVYIHAPEVAAGRLQLYKNWSPAMVPDPRWSSVGLEYFATEGDPVWCTPDDRLMQVAKKDLLQLGFVREQEIWWGFVTRYPKAYPVYGEGYAQRLAVLRSYLSTIANLECAGRYGQFRYNNMDHSIMTGMLAARRLCGERCDPWAVNAEGEYLEQK